MSKIYENENQMIIRFPKEIADKIRDGFEKNQKLNINIQPKLDDGLQFDIDIPDLKYKDSG